MLILRYVIDYECNLSDSFDTAEEYSGGQSELEM